MADTNSQQAGIDIPLPWSSKPLRVTGTWAIVLILYLAAGWYVKDRLDSLSNDLRESIEVVECNQNLFMFVSQFEKGKIQWDELPTTLHRCLAEFKYKARVPLK